MIDEKIEIMQPYVCKTMRIQMDSTEQIMQQEQFEEFLQHFDPQSFFSFGVSGGVKLKNCVRVPFKILEHVVAHIHI